MNRSPWISVELGFRHTLSFTQTRFWVVLLGVSSVWAILMSHVARDASPTEATTAALVGPIFGIAVPIALFIYCRHVEQEGLREAAITASALGMSRPAFALGATLALVASAIGLSIVLGLLPLMLNRGVADFASLADLGTTVWVVSLGAAAYVCCFAALGASGSWVQGFAFLLLDWGFGSKAGLSALVWPRAHLASLLGAATALPASAGTSVLMLWALVIVSTALLIFRLSR
ncbi:MAG TPA: hypothetical protein VL137_07055 [Polyangiaceae bacterium]|nr:hypothetical protein [Polyangiaceae bacterium]